MAFPRAVPKLQVLLFSCTFILALVWFILNVVLLSANVSCNMNETNCKYYVTSAAFLTAVVLRSTPHAQVYNFHFYLRSVLDTGSLEGIFEYPYFSQRKAYDPHRIYALLITATCFAALTALWQLFALLTILPSSKKRSYSAGTATSLVLSGSIAVAVGTILQFVAAGLTHQWYQRELPSINEYGVVVSYNYGRAQRICWVGAALSAILNLLQIFGAHSASRSIQTSKDGASLAKMHAWVNSPRMGPDADSSTSGDWSLSKMHSWVNNPGRGKGQAIAIKQPVSGERSLRSLHQWVNQA